MPASLPRHVLDELAAMGHRLDIRNVRGVGSVKAIRDATVEEVASTVGFTRSLAEMVKRSI